MHHVPMRFFLPASHFLSPHRVSSSSNALVGGRAVSRGRYNAGIVCYLVRLLRTTRHSRILVAIAIMIGDMTLADERNCVQLVC